jgi:hypothetical protein
LDFSAAFESSFQRFVVAAVGLVVAMFMAALLRVASVSGFLLAGGFVGWQQKQKKHCGQRQQGQSFRRRI